MRTLFITFQIMFFIFLVGCKCKQNDAKLEPIPEKYNENRLRTLISAGTGNAWDTTIREIGNVIDHKGIYYFYYSGHTGNNQKGKGDIYVGLATSTDGKQWTKHGKVMPLPAEDPFVFIKDGKFFMLYEDKTEVPDRHTSLAISDDGIRFSRTKFGYLSPTKDNWQEQSASSPVAILQGQSIVTLYEGYGRYHDTTNEGALGIAIDGKQASTPLALGSPTVSGAWDRFVATDDIVKHRGVYYLTYHSLARWPDGHGNWTSAVAFSHDLRNWTRKIDKPDFNSDYQQTVMFFRLRDSDCFYFLMTNGNAVDILINPRVSQIGLPACVE
jgi:predicted GH43/DUF377 family glycosyl hydrolase